MLLGACTSVTPPPGEASKPSPTRSPPVDETPSAAPTPASDLTIRSPPVDDPGTPTVDPSERLDAPARYEGLVLRAALPIRARYANLVYEGNNKHFRAEPDAAGLFRSGDETAADWRRFAAGVGGLVVLRDSLFSQQDHPVAQRPRALMMSPSWVTVAVAQTLANRPLTAPRSAPIDDDAAWAGTDINAYFGSFPVSERLFGDATRPLATADASARLQIQNARVSMQMLAAAAQAMIDAAPRGAEAVAQAGAEWIAASDRSYFGAELRRDKIIPIFVENPNEHELRDEGKGLGVWGWELAPQALAITRRVVYGRRLLDGALAVERYDLRFEAEQDRAIALLEELVPRDSSGHPLWLWVNGGTDGHGKGDPAVPYIKDFQAKIAAANIEVSRVVLLSKPSVRPWGADGKQVLETEVDRYAKLGIPLSVQLQTQQLQKLIAD
ncbi:hypothetical protein DB30_06159 [Enhygromyxa salina]|uniref:Uncharacterized protein n=2 Tax=Enhygromyxa salina TaxID=215803 RepID=A0A0C2CZ96_9BACT|nr:hypothetical protein DB30_06159 [Enhygromyxa salina]